MTQSGDNEDQLIREAKLAILKQIPRAVGTAAAVLNLSTAYTILATGKLPAARAQD